MVVKKKQDRKNKRNTMGTSQLLTDSKKIDELTVDVMTNLRRKQKRADCKSIRKEISVTLVKKMKKS